MYNTIHREYISSKCSNITALIQTSVSPPPPILPFSLLNWFAFTRLSKNVLSQAYACTFTGVLINTHTQEWGRGRPKSMYKLAGLARRKMHGYSSKMYLLICIAQPWVV